MVKQEHKILQIEKDIDKDVEHVDNFSTKIRVTEWFMHLLNKRSILGGGCIMEGIKMC